MPTSTPENNNATASRTDKAVVCDAFVLRPSLRDILPPDDIADAAEKVRAWMETNGYHGRWILGGVCSRDHAVELQKTRCAIADAKLTIEWQERQLADLRRVLSRVAKHADFSQCPPDLEDEVDRLNRGEGGPAS
jgi:hypothetical protein